MTAPTIPGLDGPPVPPSPGQTSPRGAGDEAAAGNRGPAAAAQALAITVLAKPQPQGSKTRNRFGGVRDDNAARLHPWREAVKAAALAALPADWQRIDAPVEVAVTFTFDRPQGDYRTGKNADLLRDAAPARPANRSTFDIDKLQRSIFDALTDAGVWRDDSRVVDVRASKRYVGDPAALHIPGALIVVSPVMSS